jgi:predicted TIM-barrel fold metal-dependent hydrolase
MLGADNMVMFSSDYPHWDFDNPKMALQPIRKDLRQRILVDNALELYGHETFPAPITATASVREGDSSQ